MTEPDARPGGMEIASVIWSTVTDRADAVPQRVVVEST